MIYAYSQRVLLLKLSADLPIARITYRLHLPPTPPHSPSILSTLALIKSSPSLDSLTPLGSQLHFVLLSSAVAPLLLADDSSPSGASTVVTTPSVQSTPYDGLHSLVHWGVAPWFDSYVSSKPGLMDGPPVTKKGGEAQMGWPAPDASPESADRRAGIPITKKKFAELELSLLHLKQNVEIPETHLAVHPAIRNAVAQACLVWLRYT